MTLSRLAQRVPTPVLTGSCSTNKARQRLISSRLRIESVDGHKLVSTYMPEFRRCSSAQPDDRHSAAPRSAPRQAQSPSPVKVAHAHAHAQRLRLGLGLARNHTTALLHSASAQPNSFLAHRAFSSSSAAMVAQKIDGTAVAKRVREQLKAEIAEKKGINPRFEPCLKIIQGAY